MFRKALLLSHVLVGGFFLPVAFLFAITGALYTYGIKGDYLTKTVLLTPAYPVGETLEPLITLATETLNIQKLKAPTGNPALKKVGTSWQFEWTGTAHDIVIEPTNTPGDVNVQIKKTSWHRHFVQLHKAKGGWPFKLLAALFAIGLMGLFVSGLLIAQSQPRLKRIWLYSAALGTTTFILAALLS
jgi:hypothetical protein